MATFIIILIVASLLGSVLWIRPSNTERLQMRLRSVARKKHLSIQFTHIGLPDKWDKSKNQKKVTAYHKFRTKKATSLAEPIYLYPFEVWKHHHITGDWYASHALPLSSTAKNILDQNHSRFSAVKIEFDCVSLFWNEKGSEATVQEISDLLTELEALEL
ncbi:hypothetical protein CBF23_009350 [Marinomonas agarivorans]|nr:hypothetical protein CBF23_009350 [Marinomonas agarivorans]